MRDAALRVLRGVELILHAGDVGSAGVLEELKALAPVIAVRGNVDSSSWGRALPQTKVIEVGPATVYMLHILEDLDLNPATAGFHIIISGHSHKPGQYWKDGVLYVNPGSAGPRRFGLPITVARLDLGIRPWRAEFIELAVEK